MALLVAIAHAQTPGPEPVMVAIAHPATSEDTILQSFATRHLRHAPAEVAWPIPRSRCSFSGMTAPEHATFSKSVLQVFPQQLRMAWDRQVFSGQGQYPEQVGSTQEMLSRVAATPGADRLRQGERG
jgi:hypothetical protein